MTAGRRAVFLDRDGVLVRTNVVDGKSYAVRSLGEFALFDDAVAATNALRAAGFTLVLVTNQPDVGNGLISRELAEHMNDLVQSELKLDGVKACFHAQRDRCRCRKPLPGMLVDAANEFGIDLSGSYMVGDRSSDVACGAAVNCHTVFIERHYSERLSARPDAIVSSMAEAAAHILEHNETARTRSLNAR
jgi:D-glycero-D-manno-heptose 1,7-bisphosphate phosphatase